MFKTVHQIGNTQQVIGGGDELGVEGDAGQSPVTGFAQTAHAFAPAKDALDPAPDALAAPVMVAAMTESDRVLRVK